VANDLPGFEAGLTAFLDAIPTDKGLATYDNDALMTLVRQLTALLRAKMALQSITI
jgi:hypothetical protein